MKILAQVYSKIPFATPFPNVGAMELDWDSALSFLATRIQLVETEFKEKNIPYDDVVVAEKFNWVQDCEYITLRYKIFQNKEGRLIQNVYRADILAEKIPEDIRKKIDDAQSEVNITEEIERELAARENSAVADK